MTISFNERNIRLKEQGNLYRGAKGVLTGKASCGMLTFSAGFRLGSRFAYFIYIAYCIAQPKGISGTFRQTLVLRAFIKQPERE